jgi:hypothetical protein
MGTATHCTTYFICAKRCGIYMLLYFSVFITSHVAVF